MSITCQICNVIFASNTSLSHHISKHKVPAKEYYDLYMRKPNEGICPICGKETNFGGLNRGYSCCCSNNCANKHSIDKIKQTKLERYGDENYNNVSKAQNTCVERYGCKNPQQNSNIKQKTKQTCIDRYGGVGLQSDIISKRVKETNLQRYGAANIYASEYGKTKIKETNLKRYGHAYATQNDNIKQKIKNTCIRKYNVECNLNLVQVKVKAQSQEAIRKRFESRKHKDYFRNSSWEQLFEQQLIAMGLVEDIDYIKQYYSKEKYPFFCDFYLIKPDIYIEINGTWEHGGHPFLSCQEDLTTLAIWKSKIEEHPKYKNAIYRWTVRDINKRNIAKQNKLNFVELWSKNEINEYINYLKEEIYK